jgi:PEP-CTERM motif
MSTKSLLRTAIAAVLMSTGLAAQAGTVAVQWLGFAAGSQNVTVGETNAGGNVSAAAGAFNVKIGADTFLTYCVELTQNASSSVLQYTLLDGVSYFNTNYKPSLGVSGATVVDRLGRLFTYLGGMTTPMAVGSTYSASEVSAAIQLAVWESVYEGNNALSVSGAQNDGTNKFTALTAGSAVRDYADFILTKASTVASQYSVSVVRYGEQPATGNAQDYILIQRVPEPASLALVGLALGAAGFASRRRRA